MIHRREYLIWIKSDSQYRFDLKVKRIVERTNLFRETDIKVDTHVVSR
jgi:hypothetical protein